MPNLKTKSSNRMPRLDEPNLTKICLRTPKDTSRPSIASLPTFSGYAYQNVFPAAPDSQTATGKVSCVRLPSHHAPSERL